MRNMLAESRQPKRILGLKPATWRDIIIITFIVSLIAFVAVSAKAETTEEVIKEQVAIHQENTEKIKKLELKQKMDENFQYSQFEINKAQYEWNRAQEVVNTVREIQEEIEK